MPRSTAQSAKSITRRTHSKSRNGCKQCKVRHVRCDQLRPHCTKCMLRQVPCEYTSGPDAAEVIPVTPRGTTQAIYGQSLNFPNHDDHVYFNALQFYTALQQNNGHLLTISAHGFPMLVAPRPLVECPVMPPLILCASFLQLSRDVDYVRYALLALFTLLNAVSDRSAEGEARSREYRVRAFGLLPAALTKFCEANSDAVLATSLMLLYSSTSKSEEVKLARGVDSIIKAMQPWQHSSSLQCYLDLAPQPTHVFLAKPLAERTMANDILQHLKYLLTYLHGKDELVSVIKMLRHYLLNQCSALRDTRPSAHSPREDVLRLWYHIKPATWSVIGTADPDFMLVVAYFEMATAFMRTQGPKLSLALPFTAKMRVIQHIHCAVEANAKAKLLAGTANDNALRAKLTTYRSLMALPLRIADGALKYGQEYMLT